MKLSSVEDKSANSTLEGYSTVASHPLMNEFRLNESHSRPFTEGTQKKGVIWKRTRQSHRQRQDQKQRAFKQADLDMLELSAATP